MAYIFNGASLQNGQQSNMDSLLIKHLEIDGKAVLLGVVCDGVGSLAGGAFAAGTAVQMLNKWFNTLTNTDRLGLMMRDSVLDINSKIISEALAMGIETASTMSALLLIEEKFYIVHIGDSRIYSYGNEVLSLLTKDDISETGRLNAYIGRYAGIVPQYLEGSAKGKTFLICSDGLYKRMDTNFMKAKLKSWNKRSLDEPIKSLPQYVVEQGEQDNISLAIIKIER